MNIKNIKSVGPKTEKIFNNLNIFSKEDLLTYYPYRYNFIKLYTLDNYPEEESFYLLSEVVDNAKIFYIKRNLNRLSFKVVVQNIILNVSIFNRGFLKQNITPGKKIILFGKYNKLKNTFTASDIKFNLEDNSIEAIYHLTDGLKLLTVKKIMNNLLEEDYDVYDKVPKYINEKYNFISKNDAVKFIHKPNSIEEIKKSKLKLIYEELFEFMFKINFLKEKKQLSGGIKRNIDNSLITNYLNNLPFEPTKDQFKAFEEINSDMTTSKKMNRLVLGDVGSGKTLVAVYAIYINFLSEYQTAFMAPTEILAVQHYKSILKYLKGLKISVELITGKLTKKEKDNIKKRLLSGEIDLLIGTHALISEDVIFKNLGLVITDEQHRFGVIQRKNLENKGINPDVLYLSATPIPRTYALVLYGDSDVSIIKTKPVGRKEIITSIVKNEDIKILLQKMYEEIKNNKQIFVVSPLIEESEDSDLVSVTKLLEKFKLAFKDKASVKVIHGAMKQDEKDSIMNEYLENKINILISTTVIEVGIDVPNATVMAIFDAQRFGLATLHQLRGRVGRGDSQSYCFLVSDHDNKRLKVMEESNDGFYITEKDFENRREGDLFGTKQSGDMVFKLADLKKDIKIVMQAQKDAEEFVNNKLYENEIYYKNIVDNINKLT